MSYKLTLRNKITYSVEYKKVEPLISSSLVSIAVYLHLSLRFFPHYLLRKRDRKTQRGIKVSPHNCKDSMVTLPSPWSLRGVTPHPFILYEDCSISLEMASLLVN